MSDLKQKIKKWQHEEQTKKPKCTTCNGTGLIFYKKEIEGRMYEFARKCYCRGGE